MYRAVHFNQQNTERKTECLALQRRDSGKNDVFFGPFGKTKSTQPSGTVFVNRIEPAKKNKIDLELLKIENCKLFFEW